MGIDYDPVMHGCMCYWMCEPCTSGSIWSGEYRNLEDSTPGYGIWQGYGDPEEATTCSCPSPGPEKRCDECL